MVNGGVYKVVFDGRGHDTIDHTADMGLVGWGRTLEEAFEEAALAMAELIADTKGLSGGYQIRSEVEGADLEELLIEFLNSILMTADLEESICSGVSIEALASGKEEYKMAFVVDLVKRTRVGERLRAEVKGATYFGAKVKERFNDIWEARCVVDM